MNMTTFPSAVHVEPGDFSPPVEAMRREVLQGLRALHKNLPCKYFYDPRGSRLFDQICDLPEYYPTRTEEGILQRHADEMADRLGGDRCTLVEYGSGSSRKTRILLDRLPRSAYVPIDISGEHLARSAARLAQAYPELTIHPICADYTRPLTLPRHRDRCSVVFFPGSTIGNFHPADAQAFLRQMAGVCGAGGGILIGVDLRKDPRVLENAYNDARGVTAAFNLNLLHRLNRELDADFDLSHFSHHAPYNPHAGRIEMHLISTRAQTVVIGQARVSFTADEAVLTECSYKYTLEGFAALAAGAGLRVEQVWTDPQQWFSVQYLVAD
jgi:dimethylhistidine N-methyltransferase